MMATALLVPCVLAGAIGFAAWVRPASRVLGRTADLLGATCLSAAVAVWIARWAVAGHIPLFGTYESALSLAVAALAAGALGRWRWAGPAGVWPVTCGVAAAILAHGSRYDPTVYALTISERSWWVDLHAVMAWAAFGALLANAGLAARWLVLRRDDRALGISLSLGFMLHTLMLVSGSFYKFLLFGRAWSFDPIETLALVAWVAYGTLLHMHLFAGWDGRRLARWCVGLFVLLVASYRGIVYFPAWSTYHIFDMDLRIHVTGAETVGEGDHR